MFSQRQNSLRIYVNDIIDIISKIDMKYNDIINEIKKHDNSNLNVFYKIDRRYKEKKIEIDQFYSESCENYENIIQFISKLKLYGNILDDFIQTLYFPLSGKALVKNIIPPLFHLLHLKNRFINILEELNNNCNFIKPYEEEGKFKEKLKYYRDQIEKLTQHCKSITNEKQILEERISSEQFARINNNIGDYVSNVEEDLKLDSCNFEKMSRILFGIGIILCLSSVIVAFYFFYIGINNIFILGKVDKYYIIYLIIKGGVSVSILFFLAYTCFLNAQRYSHESIRRKDIRHAVKFGKLFLQIYGDRVSPDEMKDVFKDWNISGKTAFSQMDKNKINISKSNIDYLLNKFEDIKDIFDKK